MLGNSKRIKTVYLENDGHDELQEWLEENDVDVMDIKMSMIGGELGYPTFLVIYRENP